MSPEQLCEQWLKSREDGERARLLAAADSQCLAYALEQARRLTTQDAAEAIAFAALAVALAEKQDAPLLGAAAWRVRGQALRVLGRHMEAVVAFESAAASARQAGDERLAAQVQIGSIDSLGMLGRYEDAFALAARLEAALRAAGAEEDAAKALFNAGSLYFRRDRYAAALDCYQRAGEILARAGNALVTASVQINCANVLTHLGRVNEAVSLYEQARAVYEAQEMPVEAAVVDTNAGFLHHVSGRHATALAALTRAYGEFHRQGRDLEAARCDIDTAEAYRALNLYPESLACCERAIPILNRLSVEYDRARAELGRAAALTALRQPNAALTALEHADAVFRTQKNALQRAHTRLIRAHLLRSEGRRAEAVREARAAAATFARNRLPGWAAEARFLPAELDLQADGNAVRRMQAVARASRRTARGWLECRAERALGLHYARQANFTKARRHFRAGIAALEDARTLISPEEMHVAFFSDKQAVYEDLVGLLLTRGRSGDIAEALECVERAKSRLLLERVQDALPAHPPAGGAAAQAHARLAALRAELSLAYHRTHTFGDDDPRRFVSGDAPTAETLEPLEAAYRAALRELEMMELAAAPNALRFSAGVSADALRAALEPEETLVEFYVVAGEVCAFIVNRKGLHARVGLARQEDVLFAARRLRYHLQKMETAATFTTLFRKQLHAEVEKVLGRLYDLLLRPLETLLAGEKIVLIPYGALHGLPFHAFFDGAQSALDRWEFLYAPSAAIWQAKTETGRTEAGAERRMLIMGVPEPGIARVSAEVEQLQRFRPDARAYCGDTATLAAFHAEAGRCAILHLATHALYREDNPLFSALQFADGRLLARDLYEMTLRCDLATLSACHTGVACVEPGDELFGLVRGFLAAGARSVVASLWSADDGATAELMTAFYAQLAQGRTKAQALRTAQREIRAAYSHPYYWAAFSLIGKR